MAERTRNEVASSEQRATPPAKPGTGSLLSSFDDIERLFESWWPQGWMQPGHWSRTPFAELARLEMRMPKVDIIDRDGEVLVKAELPGVAKEDLDVTVSDDSVTIKGKTSHEEKEEKGDYFRSEMRRGTFSRTVGLPGNVDAGKASAQFKDGVLELTLPKIEKSKRVSVKIK